MSDFQFLMLFSLLAFIAGAVSGPALAPGFYVLALSMIGVAAWELRS